MRPTRQETADLVTFTEEILHEKLHFLCSVFAVIEKPFEKLRRSWDIAFPSP